ncbi:MAG TPA: hypothetical protein VK666_26070 [Chryseolinea sp.]|nr:hypothetical protein [Chryseolinea sp.]
MKVLAILVLLLVITPSIGNAQVTKCKCTTDDIDSFTGDRIVQTKFYPIGVTEKGKELKMSIRRVNTTYFIHLVSPWPYNCAGPLTKISFKNTGGIVYNLKHIGEVDCGSTNGNSGITTKIPPNLMFRVEDENILRQPIAMIRLEDEKDYINLVPTVPFSLKTVADCADTTFKQTPK